MGSQKCNTAKREYDITLYSSIKYSEEDQNIFYLPSMCKTNSKVITKADNIYGAIISYVCDT